MVLVTASLLVSTFVELLLLMGCVLSENNRTEAMVISVILSGFMILNMVTLVLYHAN
jgi:hypothetical protein